MERICWRSLPSSCVIQPKEVPHAVVHPSESLRGWDEAETGAQRSCWLPSLAPPWLLHRPSTLISRDCLPRSEEHTSELQSPYDLVCRLLLEKKKNINIKHIINKKKKTKNNIN